jgi:hypothetical protein
MKRIRLLPAALFLVGAPLLVAGIGMIYLPAGMIAAGVILTGAAIGEIYG